MNIERTKRKIEKRFLDKGFKKEIVNDKWYLVYNSTYCKITYLEKIGAFVVESADNIQDAANGILEDGDLYYLDVSEEDMLCQLDNDIVMYYMD